MADGGGRSGGSHNVDLDGNYSVQVDCSRLCTAMLLKYANR